jgi:hypothetical protein
MGVSGFGVRVYEYTVFPQTLRSTQEFQAGETKRERERGTRHVGVGRGERRGERGDGTGQHL